MEFLIGRLLQLGGLCLSEPCKAWCVSLCLLLNGMPHCTDATRAQVLQHFKKEYARRNRKAPRVDTLVVNLPLPMELKTQQPALYRAVFGDQDPVPSQIDVATTSLPVVFCRSSSSKSLYALCLQWGGPAAMQHTA